MPPPEIRNPERIAPDRLAQMQTVTKNIVFASRNIQLRILRNVYVADEGLVLHPDLTPEPCTVRQHTKQDVLDAQAATKSARDAGTIPRIQGDTVLCRRPGTLNYGHWLVEMLPIAWFAAQHWPHPARFMVQDVQTPLAAIMEETLGRLGIPQNLHVRAGAAPVLAERLVLVEGLTHHGSYIAPQVLECLDRLSNSLPPGPYARLFVSRGQVLSRRLVDEGRIAAHALRSGFACIQPGLLPFAAQAAAFKGARRIVGVMGATLTNLVFAPRGATAFMLSPARMPDTFFWFICGLRGIRLVDMRCASAPAESGRPDWDGNLTLDATDEDAALDAPTSPPPNINALLNPDFYRATHGHLLPAGADPLEHYCTTGWQRGWDPSPHFSTTGYLAAYPDVAQAGMNPLIHYVEHGIAEGRSPFGI